MHFVSTILTIPQPFHPPRKNWRALPPGAPACQKIAYILFQTFWQSNLASATAGAPSCQKLHTFYFQLFLQSPGPSTHPVKIWRALPRGHLRVRTLHTFNSENFGNPRAFPPPPRKNLTSLRGHLRVKKIHAFCFQNFGNPRAFPLPPRKNWRALPPGAPACQKIA